MKIMVQHFFVHRPRVPRAGENVVDIFNVSTVYTILNGIYKKTELEKRVL